MLMSNVTHTVAGIAFMELACALVGTPDGHLTARMLIGSIAGNFPDNDSWLFELPRKLLRDLWSSVRMRHRGITHDLLVGVLAAFALTKLCVWLGVCSWGVIFVLGPLCGVWSHLLLDAVDADRGFMLFGLFSKKLFRLPIVLSANAIVPKSIRKFLLHRPTRGAVLRSYFRSVGTEMRYVGRICAWLIVIAQAVRWLRTDGLSSWISALSAFTILLALFDITRTGIAGWTEGRRRYLDLHPEFEQVSEEQPAEVELLEVA